MRCTPSIYEEAERKYQAVSNWLSAEGSPLHGSLLEIYPQGSVATQTTVKPRGNQDHEEFDVDLVLQGTRLDLTPMGLYRVVLRRLQEHGVYQEMIEPLKRCIRLNYAGRFHLDVLPAIPDLRRGGTCVLVPNRKLPEQSSPSDPRGFAAWFNGRAEEIFLQEAMRAAAEPLPDNLPSRVRPPVKRAVQLLKRRRDVMFSGSELAPRSVVLTTLAGHKYTGEQTVMGALHGVLDGIQRDIDRTRGPMQVRNPTNDDEIFSEAWNINKAGYAAFKRFIATMRSEIEELRQAGGLPNVADKLAEMFGEGPARQAAKNAAEQFEALRRDGKLRVAAAGGLSTALVGTRPIPRNSFFGA